MTLALLKENERLFTRAFEAPASVRLGRSVFNIWRIATGEARIAEHMLMQSMTAKVRFTKLIDAEMKRLSPQELYTFRNELVGHLSSLRKMRAEAGPESLRKDRLLRTNLEEMDGRRGAWMWIVRRQIAKALAASVTVQFATKTYEAAIDDVLREKLDPALGIVSEASSRRIVTMADRQFSPEREAGVRARIAKPTAQELEWGREVSRRIDLQ